MRLSDRAFVSVTVVAVCSDGFKCPHVGAMTIITDDARDRYDSR